MATKDRHSVLVISGCNRGIRNLPPAPAMPGAQGNLTGRKESDGAAVKKLAAVVSSTSPTRKALRRHFAPPVSAISGQVLSWLYTG
jgi:hypothetical protein